MKRIALGYEKESAELVEYSLEELGGVLIAGAAGSGKSIFLRSLAKRLLKMYGPEALGFVIHDDKGLDYRFLKDDPRLLCPIGRDAEDFAKQLTYLELVANAKEARQPRPIYIVVIVDEFFFARFEKGIMRRLETLMEIGPKNGIFFYVATQRPALYTAAMHHASQTKLAMHQFPEDGILFCGKKQLMELCPDPGDGILIRRNGAEEKRISIVKAEESGLNSSIN